MLPHNQRGTLYLKGARNPRLISDPVKKQSVASVT
jgi:hypothetical protein